MKLSPTYVQVHCRLAACGERGCTLKDIPSFRSFPLLDDLGNQNDVRLDTEKTKKRLHGFAFTYSIEDATLLTAVA